jgi:hypothetical protein
MRSNSRLTSDPSKPVWLDFRDYLEGQSTGKDRNDHHAVSASGYASMQPARYCSGSPSFNARMASISLYNPETTMVEEDTEQNLKHAADEWAPRLVVENAFQWRRRCGRAGALRSSHVWFPHFE